MKVAVVTASILALAGVASAQPSLSPAPASVEHGDELSETTALALSAGGTALSYGLLLGVPFLADRYGAHPVGAPEAGFGITAMVVGGVGTLIAPSLGHWYAGGGWTRGMSLRVGGIGIALAGAGVAVAACMPEGECDGAGTVGTLIAIGGGAMYLVGTLHDLTHVRGRVRERNARRAGGSIAVAPAPMRDGAGLVVAGEF